MDARRANDDEQFSLTLKLNGSYGRSLDELSTAGPAFKAQGGREGRCKTPLLKLLQ